MWGYSMLEVQKYQQICEVIQHWRGRNNQQSYSTMEGQKWSADVRLLNFGDPKLGQGEWYFVHNKDFINSYDLFLI